MSRQEMEPALAALHDRRHSSTLEERLNAAGTALNSNAAKLMNAAVAELRRERIAVLPPFLARNSNCASHESVPDHL
ncbi:hypothetical protein LVO79_20600 (plasmid) [Roseivivax marinus]|uniref:hypothetical protein n=1 Tax=Roseivivax marinus TaxID=1379903 RepID=UPI001F046497|nr:hypothetical protein [Roseivivax marinus]UMA67211.1 hypothetical protein LVO79_20600 [Roseivivax marinus]